MKPLFICNPSQVVPIKKHIEDNKIFGSVSVRDLDQCFITSQEECNSRRNDYTGMGDAPSTRIYIDPFLEWGKEDYYGYHIALDILTNWNKKEAPGLVFLSAIQQIAFDKLVKGKLNSFVREFIHFDFLDLDKKVLPYSTFSTSRWKYLKAYAITQAGALDDLSHELETFASTQNPSRSNFEKVIDRIKNIPETVGKIVITLCNEYNEEIAISAFAKALQEQIKEQIKELKPHTPSAIEIPANMNILLVEDNEEHLVVLENALTERQGYFEKDKNLFSFTNGTAALQELKNSPNEYQLVLVDLRLNDENGFAQPVHGVDIIEELQKNHPLSSYTIITGMGRRGVAELLDIELKFILSKKNLYSFDTESEVDKMLSRMIDDVAQRERIRFDQYGPKNGLYGAFQFKTKLVALGTKEFKNQVDKAYTILEKFIAKDEKVEIKLKTQREFANPKVEELKDLHTSLLAFRLIYLWLAIRKDNKLYCSGKDIGDFFDEYSQVLKDWEITVPDKKPNHIGFSAPKIGEKDGVVIRKIDLGSIWPHEDAIVDKWKEELKLNLRDKNNKEISTNYPPLFEFIKLHFSFDKETLTSIGVPVQMEFWDFNDLEKFFDVVFTDYKEKQEDSLYYNEVESMSSDDLVYDVFERIIQYYLPKTFDKFMDL